MTVTTSTTSATSAGTVSLTVDGIEVSVPKGTLVIRAAELLGIAVPRFCDHPLLEPVGACRQCLVEVEGQRKPLASCTTTVSEGMVVRTQLTSEVADKAQRGVMELLLVNHPLDCPICDKGGECPLQNQAMSNGQGESRFDGPKRTFPKPIPLSTQVLLDRERCISCARCTRFAAQVAGDPFIELVERGVTQQVGIEATQPFDSYFSGNTVQICPVGALTGTAYRFRSRPFDLVSAPAACEHCASGCSLRSDHRRGSVLRRLAADDPQVNEEWNCDKGRWAFHNGTRPDRLRAPMVREADGSLVETSWPDALDVAARGLGAARASKGVGVLVGGRVTVEDAYAYGKLARVALGCNDVDFRARPHSAEEAQFLAAHVAGRGPGDPGAATYADLEHAPAVVLAGFEPEEESPIVFLRLRKAARKGSVQVFSVAPFGGRALDRMGGRLLTAAPGTEPQVLAALAAGAGDGLGAAGTDAARLLREPGAVLLVGERLAAIPGALSAPGRLAEATGARLGWVPRRAGERGAVEAGALPGLLPGGRPVDDAAARVDAGTVWGAVGLPVAPGRDTAGMLAAAAAGELGALVVGGVEPDDLADPDAALAALETVPFVVSLEVRASAVTERADVVLPVAAVEEKPGTFLSWEGRPRRVEAVLREALTMSDTQVLSMLADALGTPIGLPDPAAAARELAELGSWTGARPGTPDHAGAVPARPGPGEAVLSTWRLLLDAGRMQDGEPYLAGTAHPPVARMSAATAGEVGCADGDPLTVSTDRGSVTVPLVVTHMPDRVVWLPANSAGSTVRRTLAADSGSVVRVTAGGAA
ncbi:MAG: NADH-quinone oxidoreductase subunit G [Actinomycetes bacterium]